ncbi:MAG: Spy/CpxP family protein refolding chaperone [Gemmatimonadetes bacterium]|nr:Spy/CpxP family protein refolding chaperone [Gemmatimonadota bacterium]
MRRSLVAGLGLLVALGAASALPAQQPQHERSHAPQAHPHAQMHAQHHGRHGPHGQGTMMSTALRGITLSPAQKTKVNRIHERYVAQYDQVRSQLQPVAQQLRTARRNGDKSAERAAFQRMRPHQDRLHALMMAELREIRATLTPAQRQVFDRNLEGMRSQMRRHMPMAQPRSR